MFLLRRLFGKEITNRFLSTVLCNKKKKIKKRSYKQKGIQTANNWETGKQWKFKQVDLNIHQDIEEKYSALNCIIFFTPCEFFKSNFLSLNSWLCCWKKTKSFFFFLKTKVIYQFCFLLSNQYSFGRKLPTLVQHQREFACGRMHTVLETFSCSSEKM